jgi:hypothetical protein
MYFGCLCSLVLAAPGFAGSDRAQNGLSIAMLTTEGSHHQSAKPARPELAESCFLTWEETEQEREARKNGKEKSHSSFSLLKICYYDCLGSEVSMAVAAGQPCPPTIR